MPTIVKNKAEGVAPRRIPRKAGTTAGDQLEFKASPRRITITAQELVYKPTKAEGAAILKGEAEIARGEFVTLNELFHDVDNRRRKNNSEECPVGI